MATRAVGTAPPAETTVLRRVLRARETTPGRLGLVRTALVLTCLLAGLAGVYGALDRSAAVRDIEERSGRLSADAAELYRLLADAEATAANGFLAAGLEPPTVRARYDQDIAYAAATLARASSQIPGSDPASSHVAGIIVQLPVYTGLVEAARANNRLGLPIGGTYLSNASTLMREQILPAADQLHRIAAERLDSHYLEARALPLLPLVLALAGLAGLGDVQLMERRRTHRILALGLVTATAALAVMSLWWAGATAFARGQLGDAQRRSDAATRLDEAHIAVLEARSAESLTLLRRSGGTDTEGEFVTLLVRARDAAPDGESRRLAETAVLAGRQWREAHDRVRELDGTGAYDAAVASVTGAYPEGSKPAFDQLDSALNAAVAYERDAFTAAVGSGRRALAGLAPGTALLALAAAGGVVFGIGQRLREYQ